MDRLIRNILICGLAAIAVLAIPDQAWASTPAERAAALRTSVERKEACNTAYLQRHYTADHLVLVCYGPEVGWQLNPLVTLSEAGTEPQTIRATLDSLLPYLEIRTHYNRKYLRANYYFDWYGVEKPWISAMAQGLLVEQAIRVYLDTGEERYRRLWRQAVNSFFVPVSEGGIALDMAGGKWFLMLPSPEEGQILNAHLQALDSLVRSNSLYPDAEAAELIEAGMEALKAILPAYDSGDWSYYGIYGRSKHPASWDYHRYQTGLLLKLFAATGEEDLYWTATRFRRYESLKLNRVPVR